MTSKPPYEDPGDGSRRVRDIVSPDDGSHRSGPVLEQFVGSSDTFMTRYWGSREFFCPSGERAPGMPLPSAAEILAGLDGESRYACERPAGNLRTPVRAVVFITSPEQTGLKIHLDPTEIFALQITGTKEWTVYPQQRPVPRQGKTLPEVPSRATGQEFVLHVGDCLYAPAGSLHLTRAHSDSISIYISFGVQPSSAFPRQVP